MIITLCVKCRCATSLLTEPIVSPKTMTKDNTKFTAIVCATCSTDTDADAYNETITSDHVTSMQEWKYVTDYASRQNRIFNVNTVGNYVVVFNHDDVVPGALRVVRSQPIVTCKSHVFHVHKLPSPTRGVPSTTLNLTDEYESDMDLLN